MDLNPLEIFRNYLSHVKKMLPKKIHCSYLDAEILNKKITNVILGYKVSSIDNLDTVRYSKNFESFNIANTFELFENFIRLDIYKTTGISYTEFKSMTKKEQMLMLEYLDLKNDTDNVDATLIEAEMESKNNNNNNDLYKF